jgi:hypothetical protein
MYEMSHLHAAANPIALALASLFAIASLLHLAGLRALRRAYRRGHFPRSSVTAVGVVLGFAAVFLAVPALRIWGAMLAALILFAVVTALLNRERYVWAVPMVLLMIALAPALA